MAVPRLFVSSTCYDLQEIRFQLRNFIRDFGYDAVMSEFDDIFYNYETHVQDSCLEEINKCQLFILVVGNNYGSFYHQDRENNIPDSVTLREFKRALEIKIHKHIFINKYVEYDYKNYKRALDKVILKHFQENNVPTEDVEDIKNSIKVSFDERYHFPYDSYKFVFYFLDIIHEMKDGNAINTFESFTDIKDTLRKQWAGFMYESLTKKEKVSTIIQPLESKIDRIEKSISKLFENKTSETDSKVTFDISSLTREANLDNLTKMQEEIESLLSDVINYVFYDFDEGFPSTGRRVTFNGKFTNDMSKRWLENLKSITQSFKWSKEVSVVDLFKGFPLTKYSRNNSKVSYKTLFELYTLYNSFEEEDKNNLVNTITHYLNINYEAPVETPKDLPF